MGQVKPLNKVNMTKIHWVFSTCRALCLVLQGYKCIKIEPLRIFYLTEVMVPMKHLICFPAFLSPLGIR